MSVGRRIAANLVSLSSAEIVSKAATFFVIAYLARTLGTAAFGKLSFAQAVVAYFLLLVDLGMDYRGTREVAAHRERAGLYLDHILGIKLLATVGSFVLLGAVVLWMNKDLETKWLILCLGLSLVTTALSLEWFFRGIEKMHVIALGRIVQNLLYVALVLTVVHAPSDLLRVPLTQVASAAAACAALWIVSARRFQRPRPSLDLVLSKEILSQSLPIGYSLIMVSIYYNMDTILLSFMKGDVTVGFYNAAYKIVYILILIPGIVFSAFYPSLSRTDDPAKTQQYASAYVKTLLLLGIPIAAGGTVLSAHIIEFVYGSAYSSSVLPLRILLWNVVLIFVNMSFGSPLLAWGRQSRYARIITVGAATNVVFNFLLIPRLGMVGAAAATILAELAVFVGVYREFQKVCVVPFWTHAGRPVVSAAVMAACLWGCTAMFTNLLGLLLIGIVVYFFSLGVSGGIRLRDLRVFLERGAAV